MEAPAEAPHKVAGKGVKGAADALKKLPPWALLGIAGLVIIVALYMRHTSQQNTAAQASGDTTGSSQSDSGSGSYASGDGSYDTSGGGGAYDSGYEAGLEQGGMGGLGGGYDGGNAYDPVSDVGTLLGSLFPNGINGNNTAGSGTTAPSVTVNFPTGGGAPKKHKNAHGKPPGRNTGNKGTHNNNTTDIRAKTNRTVKTTRRRQTTSKRR